MSQLRKNSSSQDEVTVSLRPVESIRPTEAVDLESCLALKSSIVESEQWTHPIVVDARSGLIMDGNHRYEVAKGLGLKLVPCVELDYSNKEIKVCDWNSGEPFPVEKIVRLKDSRDTLPYKSTRHTFPVDIPETSIPIARLR